MTSRIRAINAQRPKLELGPTVQTDELVEYISRSTGLNTGEILLVLMELRDAIAFYGTRGRGVKLEGLGTYLPNIRLDGTIDVQHRQDQGLQRALNRRPFQGEVLNHHNIGSTADELVALWNQEHPDRPVED